MFDLSKITDKDVAEKLQKELVLSKPLSDRWRILGASLNALETDSFSETKTYPRPDHPDVRKRKPIEFLLIGVLVSLRTTLENEQIAMDQVLAHCPTVNEILALAPNELAELIKPAGMALQKSKRILACMKEVQKLNGGLESLGKLSKVEARNYLLSLPGIGPKAADCVMTIGLGFSSMVVDVNVFRMTSYLFGIELNDTHSFSNNESVLLIKERLDNAIGEDAFLCQIVHTMLLLAGRKVGKTHDMSKCQGKKYCLTCEEEMMLSPNLFFGS